jgi:hypothetical protein
MKSKDLGNMFLDKNNQEEYKLSISLFKIIVFVFSFFLFTLSRHGFLFFISAMLPSFVALLLDNKNNHKCASATIFSFNLIAIIPYILDIWSSNSLDSVARDIVGNSRTWFVIYFVSLLGYIFYIVFPIIVSKFYLLRLKSERRNLVKKRLEIAESFGIEINDTSDKIEDQ